MTKLYVQMAPLESTVVISSDCGCLLCMTFSHVARTCGMLAGTG